MDKKSQTLKNIFKSISLIRECEKAIISEYHKDEMKTPMHMSWGEEAPIATLVEVLGNSGQYFGTYRTHGLYLSLTKETKEFFGEMFGKASGCAAGRAGSMHLSSIDHGLFNSSAIVGGNISVAVGAAYTAKLQNKKLYPVTVFGDGATEAGTFWESLNLAGLHQLPMIFLCLDNGLAVHTNEESRKGLKWEEIGSVVESFNVAYHEVESADASVVLDVVEKMIKSDLLQGRPCFLRAKWFRILEHVGILSDFDAGWRESPTKAFLRQWDPLEQTRDALISMQVSETDLCEIEKSNRLLAFNSIKEARAAKSSTIESIMEDI